MPSNKFSFARAHRNSPIEPSFLTRRVDQYFHERVETTWKGGHIMKGRTPDDHSLLMVSNDYLALSDHPAINESMVRALKEEGQGPLRSDVFRNGDDELARFEQRIAALMDTEDAVTCQSGWNANVGLIQAIADGSTPVYLDMFAHTSLWEGATSAGATPRPFKHNDPESLAKLIAKYGPGVVGVDAVYSTSGTLCPLEDIVSVAEAGECILVVDESHSLGMFGEKGEGLTATMGLSPKVHFRTSSLSKAFASRGGVVAGTRRNLEYFRYESRPAIFSSGILAHEAAGFSATLSVIEKEGWRREQVQANADYLRSGLDDLGYNVSASQSQIISLVAGPEENTLVLRDALESRGIFGSVFCAPATPKNRSLVRFSVHASLTREQLDRTIAVCGHIRAEVGMAEWASTRKAKGPKRGDLRLSA